MSGITYNEYNSNFILSMNNNGVTTNIPMSDIIPPPGIIVMWYSTSATPPKGWKFCNGSTVTISGFPVVTPDLRGKFPFGFSQNNQSNYPLRSTGGTYAHSLTENEMPAHSHGIGYYTNNNISNKCLSASGGDLTVPDKFNYPVDAVTNIVGTIGGGEPHNNIPPYRVLRFIIKVDE